MRLFVRILSVCAALGVISGSAYAAESLPGEACTTANSLRFTSGPEVAGGGGHALLCQGGTWKSILSFNSAAGLTKVGNLSCTNGQILKFNGTTWGCATESGGALPALTSANIWVGNGSNAATAVAMSGDATLSNTGVLTIANNAVTSAKIAADTITAADIAPGAVGTSELADLGVSTGDLDDSAVTNVKIANATIVATTKLSATGTKDATTFLRGDNTWATVSGSGDNLGNHTASTALLMGGNVVDFSDAEGSKVLWYSNTYGTGVETGTLTNWAATNHRWRIGGTSASSGTQQMQLSAAGLSVGSSGGTGGQITLGANNGTNEGGQINFAGAGSNDTWTADAYNNGFRIYTTSANANTVQIFNNSTGVANLTVEGTVTGSGFAGSGASLTALNASNLSAGTVPSARLGTGTANNTTFLRGDGTWQTVSGSGDNLGNHTATQALDMSGNAVTASGGVVMSAASANQARLKHGSFGVILRNDGTNYYHLLTNSGDADGTWNALRPLTINLATGAVSMANGLSVSGTASATTFSGSGASLTSLPAGNLTGTLPAISGANLTSLNANNLASGTVAAARMPALTGDVTMAAGTTVTNIAANTVGLTELSATGTANNTTFLRGDNTWAAVAGDNLGNHIATTVVRSDTHNTDDLGTTAIRWKDGWFAGTVTGGTFAGSGASLTSLPAANLTGALPAISGASLTSLNATNLGSGTVPAARMPALTGDVTMTAGTTATTIGNNAVNSAKIADGTIGVVDLAATGTKNSSTFLRGDNTWAAPPGGSGGMSSLGSGTVSSAIANLNLSGSFGDYNKLEIVITDVRFAASSVLQLRVSDDAGSSFENITQKVRYSTNATAAALAIPITSSTANIGAVAVGGTQTVAGVLEIWNPGSTGSKFFRFSYLLPDSNHSGDVAGIIAAGPAVNYIRLQASGGNIAGGDYTVFGIK